MKIYLLLCLFLSSLNAANYSFIDTSVNYLDWSSSTQSNSIQKDFTYLEIEGGAGWDWGEFYGFTDLENPLKKYNDSAPDNLHLVLKPILDIYIQNGFAVHLQNFYFNSKEFYVNNLVVGISYKYCNESSNFWIIPFLGVHYQSSTYYSGYNGIMAGWSFNYDFKIFGEDFYLFNWNEIEFARAKEAYQLPDGTPIGDEKAYGLNGALSCWYKITPSFTTGIQYRYAKYKLGSNTYQSGFIYTLKYYY